MILYSRDSLGCIDNNNIELINNMIYCLLTYSRLEYSCNTAYFTLNNNQSIKEDIPLI